jgi:hypothetical protein
VTRRATETAVFAPTFRTLGVQMASQTGPPEEVIAQITGLGRVGDLFQAVNVNRCVYRIWGLLSPEREPGVVDHSRSQGHWRPCHFPRFFGVTSHASLVYCFQIAWIFDQANMSSVFVFLFRVTAVTLGAGNCVFGVHGRGRFVTFDAVARVLAGDTVGNTRRTAPPGGVEWFGCSFVGLGKWHQFGSVRCRYVHILAGGPQM